MNYIFDDKFACAAMESNLKGNGTEEQLAGRGKALPLVAIASTAVGQFQKTKCSFLLSAGAEEHAGRLYAETNLMKTKQYMMEDASKL